MGKLDEAKDLTMRLRELASVLTRSKDLLCLSDS